MNDFKYVNIGECAGRFELVHQEDYDNVYNDLREMLDQEGVVVVLNYRKQCWLDELNVSTLREALIKTIVQELPGGQVHLRTADEVDVSRHKLRNAK